jgi:hypothetical protein
VLDGQRDRLPTIANRATTVGLTGQDGPEPSRLRSVVDYQHPYLSD